MKQTSRFGQRPASKTFARGEGQSFVDEFAAIAPKLGLPIEVSKLAKSICADADAMHFRMVASRSVVAAAALYVACRQLRVTVTLRELADAFGCDHRDVGRCYDAMLERMHIPRPSVNGKSYLRHLALNRPLPEETYVKSEEIIKVSSQAGLAGRNPMTLAAAALYLACCATGEKVTQAEVAEAAGVCEVSVRECCKAVRLGETTTGTGRGRDSTIQKA